jgi:hypothetical protein
MTAAIGIQIGIGTEIDEKARISTPIAIAIAISLSTVQMCLFFPDPDDPIDSSCEWLRGKTALAVGADLRHNGGIS